MELTEEYLARRNELLKLPKWRLVQMVRRTWVAGTPPERWTKEELAGSIAWGEESQERYEAYGRVALHNGLPASDSRPQCGGTECTGHDTVTPWLETRDRYRAKAPCIDRPSSN
ncbi:hypothetical protein ACJ6WD_40015 [Streptomyces sp. VTCC 41912]|uniref:hypothetical protein n=1 Tax=Streptomyces sp. VTCC 41912 TaxID=3383243 RepID=UPI003896BFEC